MLGGWYAYQLWERAVYHQKRAAVSKNLGPIGTHDNARPHSTILTQEKLAQMYWAALEHPPYSLDLSPCDYHMFGPLKEAIGGQRFDDDEQLENFVCMWLQMRPSSFYDAEIKNLPIRWQKCIEKGGNYVEKCEFFYFVKLCFNKKLKAEVGLYLIYPRTNMYSASMGTVCYCLLALLVTTCCRMLEEQALTFINKNGLLAVIRSTRRVITGSEREARHHREEKTTMVWPCQKDARGENTKINYGLDTLGEKEKGMSKKNLDGRSTSSHGSKKSRTRSVEKQRGMAFGFQKMETAVKKMDRWMDGWIFLASSCNVDVWSAERTGCWVGSRTGVNF